MTPEERAKLIDEALDQLEDHIYEDGDLDWKEATKVLETFAEKLTADVEDATRDSEREAEDRRDG